MRLTKEQVAPQVAEAMAQTRGIPAHTVVMAMRRVRNGINYAGCSKSEIYSDVFSGFYSSQSTSPTVTVVVAAVKFAHMDAEKRKARRVQEAQEQEQRRMERVKKANVQAIEDARKDRAAAAWDRLMAKYEDRYKHSYEDEPVEDQVDINGGDLVDDVADCYWQEYVEYPPL